MTYEIQNSFSNIQIDDIEKLEKEIGFLFPSDYKDFLLRHNGGSIRPENFKYVSQAGCTEKLDNITFEKSSAIYNFFGIVPPKHHSYTAVGLRIARSNILNDEKIPDDVLPIADTGTGDIIFIKLTGETSGYIYIWLHEKLVDADDSGNLPQCYNAHYIAPSFSEFLESLY